MCQYPNILLMLLYFDHQIHSAMTGKVVKSLLLAIREIIQHDTSLLPF